MDYKRIALIAGLAIVSYLMLLQWNEDYPAQSGQPAVAEEATATVLDLPDADSAPTTEDIPSVASQPDDTPAPVQTTSNLIRVSTPVQNVTIDPNGGDIVALSLPRYPTSLDTPDEPFVLMHNDNLGTYVAQHGLVGRDGVDTDGRATYSSARESYSLAPGDDSLNVDLVLTTESGVTVTKRFIFHADDYLIDVDFIIENGSGSPWQGNLFGQLKRDGAEDPSNAAGFGMRTYLGAVLTTDDDPYKKMKLKDIDKGGSQDTVTGGWIGFSQHYFLSAWVPPADQTHHYETRKNSSGQYLMRFVSPDTVVASGETQTIETGLWAGPKDQYRLEEIAPDLNLTIDYGFLWFIAQPIFWLLVHINDVVGNYGWSIILMTLVIKLGFSWLSAKSYRSMAKMRKLTPKIQQLKDRYGDDKQKMMQEQMALWRKEKVNPMGGCLPMLLQMPVLIGIYWVLMKSVELRHADWLLWYHDLSAMDPYFILPLVMGASMFISQLMTPMTTMDPMQQKMMRLMPIFFTVFFLWFPAGLVLYWLISNVFNIGQQYYINHRVDAEYNKKAG